MGSDFEAFRRSVLLAQNQFAGFLEAPAERNKVLKGVFGFDRLDAMRDVTKGRLDVTGASLQHLAARRASAETTAVCSKLVRRLVARERARTLEALRESVLQASEVLREAEGRVKVAVGQVAEIESWASRVPTHPDTEGLFAAAATADAALAASDGALAGASAALTDAAATLEAVLSASGGRKAIQEVGDLVAHQPLARLPGGHPTSRDTANEEKATASAVVEGTAAVTRPRRVATDAVRATADAEAAEAKAHRPRGGTRNRSCSWSTQRTRRRNTVPGVPAANRHASPTGQAGEDRHRRGNIGSCRRRCRCCEGPHHRDCCGTCPGLASPRRSREPRRSSPRSRPSRSRSSTPTTP